MQTYMPDQPVMAALIAGDRDRFLNVGFDGYISKPFTRRDLLKAIEMALEKKRPKASRVKNTKSSPKKSSKQKA